MATKFICGDAGETGLLRSFRAAKRNLQDRRREPIAAAPLADLPWAPDVDARVMLGEDAEGDPVWASPEERREHTLLLGKTGQGKSNHMRFLMQQDMEAGRGFCCIDPHGKLIDDVLSDVPAYRQDEVIYLDLADEDYVIGLNLFEPSRSISPLARARMISQLLQIFDKCWGGGFSGTADVILKAVCQTFLDNRTGTLPAIPKLLTDQEYREAFYPKIKDPNTLIQWQRMTSTIGKSAGMLKKEEIDPIMRRLDAFVGNPVVKNIMGQQKTTLDFPRWMAENAIVLIKIPDNDSDGIGEDAAQLLATVILQLILRAAYGREIDSTLWTVYGDEFQHYVSGDIPKMIVNTRKYGVGLFLATQSFSNIRDKDIRTALLNVGTLLCYQLTSDDAAIVAGEFRHGVELDDDWELEQKRVFKDGDWYVNSETVYHRPTKGEVASRIANLKGLMGMGTCLAKVSGTEFVLMVPNVEDSEPGGAKRARIIQRSRTQYCRPRWQVERELREELWPIEAAHADGPVIAPRNYHEPDDHHHDGDDDHHDHDGGADHRGVPSSPLPSMNGMRTRRRGIIAPLPEDDRDGS